MGVLIRTVQAPLKVHTLDDTQKLTRIYEADLRVKYKMETPNPIRHKSATVILKLTFASTTDRLC